MKLKWHNNLTLKSCYSREKNLGFKSCLNMFFKKRRMLDLNPNPRNESIGEPKHSLLSLLIQRVEIMFQFFPHVLRLLEQGKKKKKERLMSSLLLLNPLFTTHSPSLSLSHRFLSLNLSLPIHRRRRTRSSRRSYTLFKVVRAQGPNSSNLTPNDDPNSSNGNMPKSKREILLEYVRNVQPEFMELFVKGAPQQVVDAMRQTVTNMIGTLPPQFFAVTITSVAENLAQLMYSVMMTGYMFRNAQYRLELQQSLEQLALLDAKDDKGSQDYAPGTQKKVMGEVIKWNKTTGPEKIDAVKYIEYLEAEIEELNRQVKMPSKGQNELLAYLKSLEPQNLKELTSSAGEDAISSMNAFITRLLTVSDPAQMKTTVTTTTAPELGNLLFWLMVVGYSIRNIEVRFDMERVLEAPPKIAELPPGENI